MSSKRPVTSIDWLIEWLSEWLIDWLIEWLIYPCAISFIVSLIDWLIDCLVIGCCFFFFAQNHALAVIDSLEITKERIHKCTNPFDSEIGQTIRPARRCCQLQVVCFACCCCRGSVSRGGNCYCETLHRRSWSCIGTHHYKKEINARPVTFRSFKSKSDQSGQVELTGKSYCDGFVDDFRRDGWGWRKSNGKPRSLRSCIVVWRCCCLSTKIFNAMCKKIAILRADLWWGFLWT